MLAVKAPMKAAMKAMKTTKAMKAMKAMKATGLFGNEFGTVHPVSITRFPLTRLSPGAGLLRYVFFIGSG